MAVTGTLMLAGCTTPSPVPVAAPEPRAAAANIRKSAPLEVVSAQFGVFGPDAAGRRVLYETAKFPAVVSAPYGWYIIFKTDKPTVIWREEFELPVPPPTWGPGETLGIYTISPDRRTAVTERIIPTRVGFIANEWRYAPGDPIGAHKMRVYIDGQLIREFAFDIEEGPADQLTPRHGPDRSTPGKSTT
jgi:hypothetical protein